MDTILASLSRVRKVGRQAAHDEAGRMPLHEAVQRSLLGAVAFALDRGAIGRPLGLPADGLHDGLPRR